MQSHHSTPPGRRIKVYGTLEVFYPGGDIFKAYAFGLPCVGCIEPFTIILDRPANAILVTDDGNI